MDYDELRIPDETAWRPSEEEALAALDMASSYFCVEQLNMRAVVIFKQQENSLELVGWSEEHKMWEGVENGNRHHAVSGDVADANVTRKLACMMAGAGVALHEGDPPGFDPQAFADEWIPRLKEAGLLRDEAGHG